ncbi:MAG: hypothetical protein IH960_06910 [Chloroflexi bacterium]|nr:hypothetical protein [Chloroflexota bacterium]
MIFSKGADTGLAGCALFGYAFSGDDVLLTGMAAQDICFLLNIHWIAGTKKMSKKEGTTETVLS